MLRPPRDPLSTFTLSLQFLVLMHRKERVAERGGREVTLCTGRGATGQEDPLGRGYFCVLILRCDQVSNGLLIADVFTLKGKAGIRQRFSTLAEW